MPLYSVIVYNQTLGQVDEDLVKQRMVKLLKIPPQKIDLIFARKKTSIKKGLNAEQAKKYQFALEKCGIRCELRAQIDSDLVQSSAQKQQTVQHQKTLTQASEKQAGLSDHERAVSENKETANSHITEENKDLESSTCVSASPKEGEAEQGQEQEQDQDQEKFPLQDSDKTTLQEKEILTWKDRLVASSSDVFNNKQKLFGACLTLALFLSVLVWWKIQAYEKDIMRDNVAEGLELVDAAAERVGQKILETGQLPENNSQAGYGLVPIQDWIQTIRVKEGAEIVATFYPLIENGQELAITYKPVVKRTSSGEIKPGSIVKWDCKTSTIPNQLLPRRCHTNEKIEGKYEELQQYLYSSTSHSRIHVPISWTIGAADQAEASINAGNLLQGAYVISLEVAPDSTGKPLYSLAVYSERLMDYYLKEFQEAYLLNTAEVTNKEGLSGPLFEMSAKVNGRQYHYLIVFYEYKGRIYQLMSWSLSSKYENNKFELYNMLRGFEVHF